MTRVGVTRGVTLLVLDYYRIILACNVTDTAGKMRKMPTQRAHLMILQLFIGVQIASTTFLCYVLLSLTSGFFYMYFICM